mmetsp:Transcript_114413/g.363636  ORF Transcript_114413/g.363636 Transcript_114413/m.363636 type:complete len:221 (-) Transcript_114413:676-1338(-)
MPHERDPLGGLRRPQLAVPRPRRPELDPRCGTDRGDGHQQVWREGRLPRWLAGIRCRRRWRCRPQHDLGQAVVRKPLGQLGDHRRQCQEHPLLRGWPQGLRPVDAHIGSPRLGGQEEEDPLFRHAYRLEVLRQPHGLWRREVLPGQGVLCALPVWRGVLRHRQQPHPREGRHVGGARLVADFGQQEQRRQEAVGHRRGDHEGPLDGVRQELLLPLRLRGC